MLQQLYFPNYQWGEWEVRAVMRQQKSIANKKIQLCWPFFMLFTHTPQFFKTHNSDNKTPFMKQTHRVITKSLLTPSKQWMRVKTEEGLCDI